MGFQLVSQSRSAEANEVRDYINNAGPSTALVVGHHHYPWGKEKELGMGCAEIFYKQVGIPYERRFNDYYVEREPEQEDRVYNKLNPADEDISLCMMILPAASRSRRKN